MACGVNLPRWGLKLYQAPRIFKLNTRVNLPRWGLKLLIIRLLARCISGVNLPRWGLKLEYPRTNAFFG